MVSAIEKNEDGRKEIHLEFEVYFDQTVRYSHKNLVQKIKFRKV